MSSRMIVRLLLGFMIGFEVVLFWQKHRAQAPLTDIGPCPQEPFDLPARSVCHVVLRVESRP